jgi:septal ring factor EnvC (AmiA/AmiB activator)
MDVRAEVGKGTDSQAGVLRQMQEQSAQISDLALDVTRTRMGVEGLEARVAKMEKSMESLEARSTHSAKLLIAVVTLATISFGLLLVLAIHLLVTSGR